jgi:uncharacterized repeat protein (TIGR03803 family)
MKTLAHLVVTIGAAALFTGCGGSQVPISPPATVPQTSAITIRTNRANYKVVYTFGGSPDGYNPMAGLIDVGGTLYGTTWRGGAYCNSYSYPGCGTIFTLSTDGTENVLYSFSGSDGSDPSASLIVVNGVLYGTTQAGGATGDGAVFSISTSGTETVLHNFSGPDGARPLAGLINVGSTLYGTTLEGGAPSKRRGTVFSITTGGAEKVRHSFGGRRWLC